MRAGMLFVETNPVVFKRESLAKPDIKFGVQP